MAYKHTQKFIDYLTRMARPSETQTETWDRLEREGLIQILDENTVKPHLGILREYGAALLELMRAKVATTYYIPNINECIITIKDAENGAIAQQNG